MAACRSTWCWGVRSSSVDHDPEADRTAQDQLARCRTGRKVFAMSSSSSSRWRRPCISSGGLNKRGARARR